VSSGASTSPDPRQLADVIRPVVAHSQVATGALDALVDALDEAREEIRLHEESQIPVIPRAAQARLEAAEAERDRLAGERDGWKAKCEGLYAVAHPPHPDTLASMEGDK